MDAGRRMALGLLAAAAATPAAAGALELSWPDLVPERGGVAYQQLRELGVVEHGEMSTPFDQQAAAAVTSEYDGRRVRLPGFVVPLDYEGTGTTAFLLVPYVGACIHVPPPPPNQIVYVTAAEPYEVDGLFEPVWVEGEFGAAAAETQLAEVGYSLKADRVEPYEE
jgi:hypothetical protein